MERVRSKIDGNRSTEGTNRDSKKRREAVSLLLHLQGSTSTDSTSDESLTKRARTEVRKRIDSDSDSDSDTTMSERASDSDLPMSLTQQGSTTKSKYVRTAPLRAARQMAEGAMGDKDVVKFEQGIVNFKELEKFGEFAGWLRHYPSVAVYAVKTLLDIEHSGKHSPEYTTIIKQYFKSLKHDGLQRLIEHEPDIVNWITDTAELPPYEREIVDKIAAKIANAFKNAAQTKKRKSIQKNPMFANCALSDTTRGQGDESELAQQNALKAMGNEEVVKFEQGIVDFKKSANSRDFATWLRENSSVVVYAVKTLLDITHSGERSPKYTNIIRQYFKDLKYRGMQRLIEHEHDIVKWITDTVELPQCEREIANIIAVKIVSAFKNKEQTIKEKWIQKNITLIKWALSNITREQRDGSELSQQITLVFKEASLSKKLEWIESDSDILCLAARAAAQGYGDELAREIVAALNHYATAPPEQIENWITKNPNVIGLAAQAAASGYGNALEQVIAKTFRKASTETKIGWIKAAPEAVVICAQAAGKAKVLADEIATFFDTLQSNLELEKELLDLILESKGVYHLTENYKDDAHALIRKVIQAFNKATYDKQIDLIKADPKAVGIVMQAIAEGIDNDFKDEIAEAFSTKTPKELNRWLNANPRIITYALQAARNRISKPAEALAILFENHAGLEEKMRWIKANVGLVQRGVDGISSSNFRLFSSPDPLADAIRKTIEEQKRRVKIKLPYSFS